MVEPHWQHIASQRIDSRGDAREAAEHRFLKLGAVDQLHGRRGGIIDGLLCECDELDSVKVESSSVMTVEKFVDTASIRFQLLPGTRWRCWPGRLCRPPEAIAKTGMTALSRVVISRRERTIALRPMGDGLMAHTQ